MRREVHPYPDDTRFVLECLTTVECEAPLRRHHMRDQVEKAWRLAERRSELDEEDLGVCDMHDKHVVIAGRFDPTPSD